MKWPLRALAAVATLLACIGGAAAQDKLKIAIGQRGNWDTSLSEIGQRTGIFKKHGLTLEIVYMHDARQAQEAVVSGDADIGVALGTIGVLAAYTKGAPLRVVGAQMTGASDLYWYVKSDSAIRSLKDAAGKSIAYSANGAATHRVLAALIRQVNVKVRPEATGGPPGTLTQVMTGEVDVGWAAPPFGLDRLDRNEIRIIANGNDAASFKNRTVRLLVTTEQVLSERKAAIGRYMQAYRETIDWMYANPGALRAYAGWLAIPEARAKRIRDDFFPKEALDPGNVAGLELAMKDAVALKFIAGELTAAQLDELVQIPPR